MVSKSIRWLPKYQNSQERKSMEQINLRSWLNLPITLWPTSEIIKFFHISRQYILYTIICSKAMFQTMSRLLEITIPRDCILWVNSSLRILYFSWCCFKLLMRVSRSGFFLRLESAKLWLLAVKVWMLEFIFRTYITIYSIITVSV